MERTSVKEIKELFGKSFIGADEIAELAKKMNLPDPRSTKTEVPQITFTKEQLQKVKDSHVLFLAIPFHSDQSAVNILSMRNWFGTDPAKQEPCFYNQDWYLNEEFVKSTFKSGWYLMSKNLVQETRGRQVAEIKELMLKSEFPSAVLTCYFFFLSYLHFNEPLFRHDYLWNSDTDGNGDRIYVGKYIDPLGQNKNGFEIHRHLSLKSNYGAVECLSPN